MSILSIIIFLIIIFLIIYLIIDRAKSKSFKEKEISLEDFTKAVAGIMLAASPAIPIFHCKICNMAYRCTTKNPITNTWEVPAGLVGDKQGDKFIVRCLECKRNS